MVIVSPWVVLWRKCTNCVRVGAPAEARCVGGRSEENAAPSDAVGGSGASGADAAANGPGGRRRSAPGPQGGRRRPRRWLRHCLKHVRRRPKADANGGAAEHAGIDSDEFWDWYEEREYDSLHWPPGFFRPGQEPLSVAGAAAKAAAGLPRRTAQGDVHCWDDADFSDLQVRGPGYLADQRKQATARPLFQLARVGMVRSGGLAEPDSGTGGVLDSVALEHPGQPVFALTFCLGLVRLVFVWLVPEDEELDDPAGNLFRRFRDDMSDEERRSHLKLFPKVMAGPWMVTAAVPPKPAIIARQCPTSFNFKERVFEAVVDCTKSALGKKLAKVVCDGQCDLGIFVILEGRSVQDLPERVLGAAAVYHTSVACVV